MNAFTRFLTFAAGSGHIGIALARAGLIVVLLWIGGLKIFKYEADGIVPFVANSPGMSFFLKYPAPEYKTHMNPEGQLVAANRGGIRKIAPTCFPTDWARSSCCMA